MNPGNDIDWDAFVQGRGNMIMAMRGTPYTYLTNVELKGNTTHLDNVTDVTTAVKAVESQGYVTLFVTNCASGGDLYGKGSDHAPSLSITYADKRTVIFVAGDNATCATTSLSCASEGSVTSVTLPAATDNKGATFMGTPPLSAAHVSEAQETHTPQAVISHCTQSTTVRQCLSLLPACQQ